MRNWKTLKTAVGFFLSMGILVYLGRALIPGGPRGEPWERWPNAENAGFSAEGLKQVLDYTKTLGTTGLVVVNGGKVLLEYGDIVQLGYMAAGRYSILAMVYGEPVTDGTIDLDLTLEELGVDDRQGLLPIEKQATIEHLLTDRSGVYHPTEFGNGPEGTPARGSVEPGSHFLPHPWGGLALRDIFEALTGRTFFEAVGRDLAEPLGLQDFNWKRQNPGHDRSRSVFTLYNLYVSTRDVARFGQLMLQNGEWRGEQLIPREWVERITSVVTSPEDLNPEGYRGRGLGFGYQWWPWHDPDPEGPYAGAYTYLGSYGQYLTILPKLDMVVAHQVFAGWYGPPDRSVGWDQYEGILERLVAARMDLVDSDSGSGS